MTTKPTAVDYTLLIRYCMANCRLGPYDGWVITGDWDAITAQHSPADLRPVRVRGERRRRKAG